tara:strand:- start:161 stop:955 length:795 start_codon:yes stop_codon:yes gene_type:complete
MEFRGYYTTCPIHDIEGKPYKLNWRNKGLEYVGTYFECCGTVCLKSTEKQLEAYSQWVSGERKNKPRRTSLWLHEALTNNDTDIWRERGELDAEYGFGLVEENKPQYQVHEAISYFHHLNESVGETALIQLFFAEPKSVIWELDDVMGAPHMKEDIRRYHNVRLFQLLTQDSHIENYYKDSQQWLERNALLSPDPFEASKALYRLKALNKDLPKYITLSDLQSILEHSARHGIYPQKEDIDLWMNELDRFGVKIKNNTKTDYQP